MRIGVLFGGASREREISYAGGRTVYDLLNRKLFRPVPIFLDFYHRFIRLSPKFLYYGMITDFFPPADLLPTEVRFPVYAEQLFYPESSAYLGALTRLGPILPAEALKEEIDFAFLVLHGLGGEDGSIQGLLEQMGIPYAGVGIGGSAWGMNKATQRAWLQAHGFAVPRYTIVRRALLWEDPDALIAQVEGEVGFPCVVKHPLQGSTIGVAVCPSTSELVEIVSRCAFTWPVRWLPPAPTSALLDLTQGLSLPLLYRDEKGFPRQLITDWGELTYFLRHRPARGWVEAWDSPDTLLVEAFVTGEEFSVIVIETPEGEKVALPPTHIRKAHSLYDYRAKYLSGVSSKKTPSAGLPNSLIQAEAERLMQAADLRVYARLDGIVTSEGAVIFNDPNTTSGMLPASLLFHQAAEVGFTPRDFLTYLVDVSLKQVRTGTPALYVRRHRLTLNQVREDTSRPLQRIAVLFGGPSTERHISLESGRNVMEKLSSRYEVVPLFLRVKGKSLELWELPPRLLFKDNADDVAASLESEMPTVTQSSRVKLSGLRQTYALVEGYSAKQVPWEALPARVEFVFIALHGRPGEDGTIQRRLEELGLPYNGSGPALCELAMDKAATHAFLRDRGFLVPPHYRVSLRAWQTQPEAVIEEVEAAIGGYPLIGKPVDEGCSSAVRVLPDRETLRAYLDALLRQTEALPDALRARLHIQPDEPFPPKAEALLERYLHGPEWIEVTVGVITHTEGTTVRYQAFLPSETVKSETILRVEEKFLAGAGQNVTPARLYPDNPTWNAVALEKVQKEVERLARETGIHGYARIDGFVRLLGEGAVEFWPLEINALPGLTPATVFFHQAGVAGYTPGEILEHIIEEGRRRPAGS